MVVNCTLIVYSYLVVVNVVCELHLPSICVHFDLFRIVNSELTHFKGALSSLENITAFGGTLFDVWTVNR